MKASSSSYTPLVFFCFAFFGLGTRFFFSCKAPGRNPSPHDDPSRRLSAARGTGLTEGYRRSHRAANHQSAEHRGAGGLPAPRFFSYIFSFFSNNDNTAVSPSSSSAAPKASAPLNKKSRDRHKSSSSSASSASSFPPAAKYFVVYEDAGALDKIASENEEGKHGQTGTDLEQDILAALISDFFCIRRPDLPSATKPTGTALFSRRSKNALGRGGEEDRQTRSDDSRAAAVSRTRGSSDTIRLGEEETEGGEEEEEQLLLRQHLKKEGEELGGRDRSQEEGSRLHLLSPSSGRPSASSAGEGGREMPRKMLKSTRRGRGGEQLSSSSSLSRKEEANAREVGMSASSYLLLKQLHASVVSTFISFTPTSHVNLPSLRLLKDTSPSLSRDQESKLLLYFRRYVHDRVRATDDEGIPVELSRLFSPLEVYDWSLLEGEILPHCQRG